MHMFMYINISTNTIGVFLSCAGLFLEEVYKMSRNVTYAHKIRTVNGYKVLRVSKQVYKSPQWLSRKSPRA